MAKALHGSARTTPRLRVDLQASKESTRSLAGKYGLNPKTVAKWRKRTDTADAPMGPQSRRTAALTAAEEAMVVAFRRRTLLPLDAVFGSRRENLPRLSRSALHRCLVRHGISRLPTGDPAAKRKRFAATTIGYGHVDACELRTAEGKMPLFLAIDRVSKFVFVELHPRATRLIGAACRAWLEHVKRVLQQGDVAPGFAGSKDFRRTRCLLLQPFDLGHCLTAGSNLLGGQRWDSPDQRCGQQQRRKKNRFTNQALSYASRTWSAKHRINQYFAIFEKAATNADCDGRVLNPRIFKNLF